MAEMHKTPLFKSIELSGRYNGATVWVKDESRNPFGTFKDRRCAALLEAHNSEHESVYVHITAGNSGYSLGMLSREKERKAGKKISVVNIVSPDISRQIREKLKTCSNVYELDLTKKVITRDELIEIARKVANHTGPEDNIHLVEDFQLADGYSNIIDEIATTGIIPKYILCPVGEGELVTEITRRALEVWPDKPPTIIGVTVPQNAITSSQDFLKKARKSVADKLVNRYSKFKSFVQYYAKTGHLWMRCIHDWEIAQEYQYLTKIGISCEPSSASAFAWARQQGFNEHENVVIINTGKGIYDQSAIEKLLTMRLRRWAKYAVAAFVGAAIVIAGTIGINKLYMNYTQLERELLYERVMHYADKDHKNGLEENELKAICNLIPDPLKSCSSARRYNSLYLDFTEEELEFYAKYMELGSWNDTAGRHMQIILRDAYEEKHKIRYEHQQIR